MVLHSQRTTKKTKTALYLNKVIATMFWDSFSTILVDNFRKNKNYTWTRLCQLAGFFSTILRKEKVHICRKRILFYEDIAQVHTCIITMGKFYELGN